jgi:hypothetical protein
LPIAFGLIVVVAFVCLATETLTSEAMQENSLAASY